MTGETSYSTSDMEDNCGFIDINGSESYFVETPTLSDRGKRVKQFQRALRILKLKPEVHPSQLNDKLSSSTSLKTVAEQNSEASTSEKEMKRCQGKRVYLFRTLLLD